MFGCACIENALGIVQIVFFCFMSKLFFDTGVLIVLNITTHAIV
uniref:Uncharacterized protein n=1 Tax=Anguilla anguilla TaxID=7936 RepID=A0A0E9Q172_ANGAN